MEFNVIILIHLIALFGTLGAGIYLLAEKWGVIEFYTVNRKKWMPPFCGSFCYSFWFVHCPGLALLIFVGFPFDWLYLFAPLCASVLTRILAK